MSKQLQSMLFDGSSQAGRVLKALDPAYVSVDERSLKDLLAWARRYAQELSYFNEQNVAQGDWSGLLGEGGPNKDDLDAIVAFINEPERFLEETENKDWFTRPHLVLFITFLKLLQQAQSQLNDLTRRHLEFYYREALQLTSRAGTPDQVHLLLELADGQDQFLLPAGTLFAAGQDSQGKDLLYSSDGDLMANRATVAAVKNLFAEKQVIGIREARLNPDILIELFPSNKNVLEGGVFVERSFLAMLMMVLGEPGPGEPLPAYPDGSSVDTKLLAALDSLLGFVQTVLYMPISTFRSLMQLKSDQQQAYSQWDKVNNYLEASARSRLKNPQFTLDRSEPANFEKNLLAALGRTAFGDFFNELPEVQDIYDLYRRRDRADVIEFIQASVYMSVADFSAMMAIEEEIIGRWRQIYEILRAAGRKKQRAVANFQLQAPQIRTYVLDKFSDLVQRTLGTIDYSSIQGTRPANFDNLYAKISQLEDYFHTSAEDFIFIRKTNSEQGNAQPWEWDQVYAVLEAAYAKKTLEARRNVLRSIREAGPDGFSKMILFALGDPNPGDALPGERTFESLDPALDQDYLTTDLFLDPANFTYIMSIETKAVNATPTEWANVYAVVELAQRQKRQWVQTPAEIEKWENVYIAQDASQVLVQAAAADGQAATPRWKTFGEGYVLQDNGQPYTVPGEIGFAIAAPLLALAEGKRTITLTIAFQEENFDLETFSLAFQGTSPFHFLISTEKGMIAVADTDITIKITTKQQPSFTIPGAAAPYTHALQITLQLDEQTPAIAPLATGNGIQAAWPVLQIILADLPREDNTQGGPLKRYRAFQGLALEKLYLTVDVSGITQLALQNDAGPLDPKKPIELFGSSPVSGSSFYLAHPELCSKKLDQFGLSIDWLGAPDNFSTFYLGYLKSEERETDPTANALTSPISDNTIFKAGLKLYDNRSLFNVGSVQLFHADTKTPTTGATQTNQIQIKQAAILAAYKNYQGEFDLQSGPEVLDWSRYWQMELLAPDFQHTAYPRVAAACASKIVSGTSADPRPKPYIVNPPYTPRIKHLSASYTASLEIDLASIDLNQQAERLYHIEPFGYRDLAGAENKPYPFLPLFDNEGELFIGITALAPPQSLALLFQMAEGSADPNLEREPVHWSFLDGNVWSSLEEGRLLSDSTNGLLNSGIINFDLPSTETGTLLPSGLYWLKASIARNSHSVGDTIGIHTQALSATFENHDNAPDHLTQPLPAESIKGLADAQPEVKAIHQPYSSFGGKNPEQAGSFYTRASERLRHKNRALTCWDYEHLVLDAFPGIYKVKCLPAGALQDPRLAEAIQVIVIPDIHGKLPFDPFEPKLPADMLLQIEQFLTEHSPSFANVKVKNPTYVRLKARLGVRLRQDTNTGYYKNLLNEELQRYLAPWAYDGTAEIVFGGKINASLIINFLEQRPYVDYVAGLKLFTSLEGQQFTLYDPAKSSPLGDVSVLAPDAILVSDRLHQIDLITEEGYEQQFFTGITI